jgi:DNA-binding HxlR family transcriptional regulator
MRARACHMGGMDPDFRSTCPIARALDIVGDRWTLVVLRSMLVGAHRYNDFLTAPEQISTNVLADRLDRLVETGLVERRLYQERPERHEYWLTERGADFLPVLQALAAWSLKHLQGCYQPPATFMQTKPEDFLQGAKP